MACSPEAPKFKSTDVTGASFAQDLRLKDHLGNLRKMKDFKDKIDFVAQNVRVKDDAMFDYKFQDFPGFNADAGLAFKPYTIKTVGGALLVAGGLATESSGVSDGMNDETMHRGALMIISGGVVSALFAVVMRATGATSPE